MKRPNVASLPRSLLVLAMALVLSGCGSLFFSALNSGLEAPPPQRHVFDPGRGLALDAYTPPDAGHGARPAPVLLFFYGGSWTGGERGDYRFVGEALSAEGVLVIIPDYRKAPDTPFPGFVEDAARAVAWARANAPGLGGDPDRIVLAGHSAGAHIAAMLALEARWLEREDVPGTAVDGFIGLAGPYDFLPSDDPDLVEVFGRDPERQLDAQPVRHVGPDAPRSLLIHGDADRLVELRNSRSLAAALQQNDVPVTLRVIEGVGHIRLLAGLRAERLADVRDPMRDFIHAADPD